MNTDELKAAPLFYLLNLIEKYLGYFSQVQLQVLLIFSCQVQVLENEYLSTSTKYLYSPQACFGCYFKFSFSYMYFLVR